MLPKNLLSKVFASLFSLHTQYLRVVQRVDLVQYHAQLPEHIESLCAIISWDLLVAIKPPKLPQKFYEQLWWWKLSRTISADLSGIAERKPSSAAAQRDHRGVCVFMRLWTFVRLELMQSTEGKSPARAGHLWHSFSCCYRWTWASLLLKACLLLMLTCCSEPPQTPSVLSVL